MGTYRYLQGIKPEVGEHSFFSDASGSNRNLQMDSPLDNTWPLMPSRVASFPASKSSDNSVLQNEYPQHSFFHSDFASGEPVKQEGQSLRPFFDEWPKTRDSWSGLEDERSNQTSFSTTQLSISIPMTTSDFSSSSQSPHGEFQSLGECFLQISIHSDLCRETLLQIIERSMVTVFCSRYHLKARQVSAR